MTEKQQKEGHADPTELQVLTRINNNIRRTRQKTTKQLYCYSDTIAWVA